MFNSRVQFTSLVDLEAIVDYGLYEAVVKAIRSHDNGRGIIEVSVELMGSTDVEHTGQVQIHFLDLNQQVYSVEYIDFDA